jgi:diaminopimelate epimerase
VTSSASPTAGPYASDTGRSVAPGLTFGHGLDFAKGHGTRNDFVLLDDRAGRLDLTAELVRALADRRGGIGADGVIRVVPTAALPAGAAILGTDPGARWFMDYRNGDGSVAQMCGNGIRVFAAFLERLGLAEVPAQSTDDGPALAVGTRAGVRRVRRTTTGWYAVDMGPWRLTGDERAQSRGADAEVTVAGLDVPRPALSVDVGNPHVVLALADTQELAAADLTSAPAVWPAPPHGTNVELVVPLGEEVDEVGRAVGRVQMRVYERGVGETRSCGTGACAAALAVRAWAGAGAPDRWLVDVPGGQLAVRLLASGNVELAGPAELVATGRIDLEAVRLA